MINNQLLLNYWCEFPSSLRNTFKADSYILQDLLQLLSISLSRHILPFGFDTSPQVSEPHFLFL